MSRGTPQRGKSGYGQRRPYETRSSDPEVRQYLAEIGMSTRTSLATSTGGSGLPIYSVDDATIGLPGLVPGGGTTGEYLDGDGTWKSNTFSHGLAGTGTGSVTSVVLEYAGFQLLEDLPGVPVASPMHTATVAVSWLSDDVPAGPWTLTLQKRPSGGGFSDVATFSVSTS